MAKFVDASEADFMTAASVGAFKGAVKNLNNNVYHSLKDYWSSTHLKYMSAHSPAHFKDEYLRDGRDQKKTTEQMILGSLVHTMVLAPSEFEKDFFLMPDINLRTNEGKAAKQELLSSNPGKTPITDEILAEAQNMREAILSNPKARELLEPGIKEAAYFWTCPFSSLNFKAKLDHSSSGYFCELKTTTDAGPDNFARHAFNMNYDLSLYHYREGLKQVMGAEGPAYFIVVESKPPYVTQVYKAGDGFWQTGHEKWLNSVTKLADGIQKKSWPSYFPPEFGIPELNPPSWAINKLLPVGENGI